ncbi:MAG: hypothetical protein GY800_05705 [Planctomycetes bacterium]|nr:hypothetical protein [Planctomycetota bacterium]
MTVTELFKILKWSPVNLLLLFLLAIAALYYLFASIRFDTYGSFIIGLLDAVAWPAAVVIVAKLYYEPIVRLLDSITEYMGRKGPGEGE